MLFLIQGANDKAVADFNEMVRRAPKDALGYYGRGLALHLTGQEQAAAVDLRKKQDDTPLDRYAPLIAFCSDIVRRNPKLAEAYVCRGMMLADAGDPERAAADFDEALRLGTPYAVFVHGQRAVVHAAMGSPEKAKADLEEARKLTTARRP